MSANDARRYLKPGDLAHLKAGGWVFLVSSVEESGRIVYGQINKRGPVVARKNSELTNTVVKADKK